MHRPGSSKLIASSVFVIAIVSATPALAQSSDWQRAVDQALAKGQAKPDDIYSVSLPRDDLRVMRGGVRLRSGMDFGSGVNFKPMGDSVMAMGELAVTDDEAAGVLTRLEQHGIEVTALHKHVLKISPSMMWIHVRSHGDAATIAANIKDALRATGTRFPTQAASKSPPTGLRTADLSQIVGGKGEESGGVLQFRLPIVQGIREGGMDLPAGMGPQIELNMQSVGNGRAVATGEFPVVAAQVNPVVRTMREQGFEVAEVHNHMLDEEPRMFWVHIWGADQAARLATRMRAVVDVVPTKK